MIQQFSKILEENQRKTAYWFDDSVCLSYPLPDMKNGRKTERMFLYNRGVMRQEGPRPFGLMTLDYASGRLLAYQDGRLEDFMDTAAYPFDRPVSYALNGKISVKDFKMEQAMVRKLYEGVRRFAFQDTLTKEEKEVLEKFCFLMEHAVPAELLPYYETMGKNFYRWVKEHV
ncbi:MAG: hypothetical protein IK099_07605 [Clostridia bacterium]|nr:hypothetical protein [Clostridia bacterium]